MVNRISERFFDKGHDFDLYHRGKKILSQVIAKTGFVVDKEIFRGKVYDDKKVGSILYRGTYESKNAVLKLQGLQVNVDEVEIIRKFESQNASKIVHAPRIYLHEKWNATRRYGFTISELVDAPFIFRRPFASDAQMKEFCRFYKEYTTKAITNDFIPKNKGK